MNGDLVIERNDPENLAFKLGNGAPEPESVRFLSLNADRRLDNPNAEFLCQVRPLFQHLLLEVFGEPIVGHCPRIDQTEPERSKQPVVSLKPESATYLDDESPKFFFVSCLPNVRNEPRAAGT